MYRGLLRFYFTLNVVLLVFLAFSFLFIEPGSASMVIAKLNALILVPSLIISGALIYRQGKREADMPIDFEDDR